MATLKTSLEANYDRRTPDRRTPDGRTEKATYSYRSAQKYCGTSCIEDIYNLLSMTGNYYHTHPRAGYNNK